jgi:hypothetical protein
LAETFKILKNSSNQEDLLKQLVMQKPEVKNFYDSLSACNGDYESVYMRIAKQQGKTEEQARQSLTQTRQLWDRM